MYNWCVVNKRDIRVVIELLLVGSFFIFVSLCDRTFTEEIRLNPFLGLYSVKVYNNQVINSLIGENGPFENPLMAVFLVPAIFSVISNIIGCGLDCVFPDIV